VLSNAIGGILGVASLVLGAFFVYYGIKSGMIDQHIVADFRGNFLEGKEAFNRGIVYLVVGLGMLAAAGVVALSLYRRLTM